MAKETHIKTDKKTVGGWGAWELPLDYEKLTNSQELETKKLIHYLDLDWQDECLSPHMNTRAVKTASQQQVRKKVYQGSSQKWLKYEPFLNGAFDGLTELNGGPLLEIEK